MVPSMLSVWKLSKMCAEWLAVLRLSSASVLDRNLLAEILEVLSRIRK